jgi:hypothetical protein
MSCLQELVEFVTKGLDSEQIGEILLEVEATPKYSG